jgi:phage terminase large subunit-like protein
VWLTLALLLASIPGSLPSRACPVERSVVVDYRPEWCAYCGSLTWCELRSNAKRQCRACKVERFFNLVLYPPLDYQLIGWTRKVLRDIYGTVRPEDGKRRYRSAFIEVAKKNGKSFLIGGLPIYYLLMEEDRSPEAYGGAAAKDQAGLVFKSAALLVNSNPELQSKLKVLKSTKRIVRRDGGGFYVVLSADGDIQDGIEPGLSIRDEVHRWKTARAETLRDVMTKGQISRDEPLDIAITTAGAEYESPLWLEEYEHAKLVFEGAIQDPTLYVAIYEPDLKRLNADPDYWKSREARVAANPSHEDNGGFLKDTALVVEMNKAFANPRAKSKYFRYHLNVPVKSLEDPVIEMTKWQECGGGIDLRAWDSYDLDRLIEEWRLANQPCYVGVDASWTTDLTAAVVLFPPFEGVAEWTWLPFFWMPEQRVEHLEHVCRVPFSNWVARGFITATPGGAIDLQAVKDRILWARDRFTLVEVPFDRMNFRVEGIALKEKESIETVEVPQNFLGLSAATKFLLSTYGEKQVRHGNNPVYNWMAACLQLQYDHKDNCQPVKPERMRSAKRIDGMQATVTGLSRAMLAVPQMAGPIEVW